jgi:hypothetical protein
MSNHNENTNFVNPSTPVDKTTKKLQAQITKLNDDLRQERCAHERTKQLVTDLKGNLLEKEGKIEELREEMSDTEEDFEMKLENSWFDRERELNFEWTMRFRTDTVELQQERDKFERNALEHALRLRESTAM